VRSRRHLHYPAPNGQLGLDEQLVRARRVLADLEAQVANRLSRARRHSWVLGVLHAQLPPVAVKIVEPEAHVLGAGRFRTDLVARIFELHLVLFEMLERFSQRRHVRQMERHVTECSRRRLAFVQRNRDAVVADCDATFELELLLETKRALEPFRAFFRVPHRQSEMTDHTYRKWSLHRR
jgi:hypothetical protein